MVTIGTCALVVLAVCVFGYCEYHKYWDNSVDADGLGCTAQPQAMEPRQQLSALTAQFEIEHQGATSLSSKFSAIWRFIQFVLFDSPQQKQERIRRNDLTAEKLLFEYQSLVRLPGNERVDRFIRWRDDVADYEARKKVEQHSYQIRFKE